MLIVWILVETKIILDFKDSIYLSEMFSFFENYTSQGYLPVPQGYVIYSPGTATRLFCKGEIILVTNFKLGSLNIDHASRYMDFKHCTLLKELSFWYCM